MWWLFLLSGCADDPSYARPRAACTSRSFPVESVVPEPNPETWMLRERWAASRSDALVRRLASAPFADTDGDGRIGIGDRMDVVTFDNPDVIRLRDGVTGEVILSIPGVDFQIADVDASRPGPELVVTGGGARDPLTLSLADRNGSYLTASLDDTYPASRQLTVVDLDGDGLLEILGVTGVYDFATGALRFAYRDLHDTARDESTDLFRVVDLDGDGRAELLGNLDLAPELTILDADGRVLGTCPAGDGQDIGYQVPSVAVGNLDADPELEVVSGSQHGIRVCDLDGTVLARSDLPAGGGITIAQLDTDPEPELVVDSIGWLSGLEHDLSPMAGTSPFLVLGSSVTVADFDGDGIHELLHTAGRVLSITRADGVEVARYALSVGSSGLVAPMVADLDADGLAEIVIADHASESIRNGLSVLDNPLGGWPIPGAALPWSGDWTHGNPLPEDVRAVGPGPEAFVGGDNVWNGRPVAEPQCSTAVDLDLRDVCVESCDGDAILTVYASNRGVMPLSSVLEIEIWSDGKKIGSAPMPLVEPELAVPVSIPVPAARIAGDLEARLGSPGTSDCAVPTAFFREPVCP